MTATTVDAPALRTGRIVLTRGEPFSLPPRGRLTTWSISNHDGQQIGHVVTREADLRLEHIGIEPEHRRSGFATEAIQTLVGWYGGPLVASVGSHEGGLLLA